MNKELPPGSTPTPLPDNFQTISPALAAAFIAARQLTYSRCELHRNGRDVIFFFEDPEHIGDELRQKYSMGTFPLVDAKMLADARSYLAKENNRLKGATSGKR